MKRKRIFQTLSLCFLIIPIFLFVLTVCAQSASPFINVTYPGAANTYAKAVNDSGQVAGYFTTGTEPTAFLYDGTSYFSVSAPQGVSGTGGMYACGINDSGQVVGYYEGSTSGAHSWLYADGVTTAMPDPPGATATYACGINDSGQVVGTYYDGQTHGFLYNGGAFITLPEYSDSSGGPYLASPYAINNKGLICGAYTDSNGSTHAFVYSIAGGAFNMAPGTFTTFDFPGAIRTEPHGINDSGQISGSYEDGTGWHGFVYSMSTRTFTTLFQYPGSASTQVGGINNVGQVAGNYTLSGAVYGFTAPVPPPYTFTTLDPDGSSGTYATNYNTINNIGQVTGYYDTSTMRGFLYTPGAATPFDTFDADTTAVQTMPLGINSSGTVVGWWTGNATPYKGFEYSNSTGAHTIIYNDGTSDFPTLLVGVNDNDLITGYYIGASSIYRAFVYDGSSFKTFSPPTSATEPVAINNKGQVAGWTSTTTSRSGFVYDATADTFVTLDPDNNPSTTAEAVAINDAGQVAGGYLTTGSPTVGFGFVYSGGTSGTYTTFAPPGATALGVTGMNKAGKVSGVFTDSSGIEHGFVYNGGIFTILDFPATGTTSTSVMGINDSDQVGGYYQNPQAHGFIASPTPYTYYLDKDGDGYGDPTNSITSTSPLPTPGYVRDKTDCNDSDATVFPGAAPVCGQDKSCSGTIYGTNGTGPECASVTGGGLSPSTVAAAPGQPMWMTATYTFTNNSASTIWVMRPDCFNTLFTLTDQATGRIPASLDRVRVPYIIPNDTVPIANGGSQTFEVKCNVAEMYATDALAGTYNVQATYSNWVRDPDIDTSTSPPSCSASPCYSMWTGAVAATSTPPTVTASGNPVRVLPGLLSFDQSTWYVGWPAGPTITATLTLAPGVSLPANDAFDNATVTLNGIPANSSQTITGGITAQFNGTAAVNSLGTVSPGQTVYPEVEAILSSGDVVRASTKVTVSAICYQFSGFFAPITDSGTGVVNTVKAGQAVPIKLLLTDCNGNGISDPNAFKLYSQPTSCTDFSYSTTNDLSAIDTSAGSSGLQYLGNGYWQYNWKTSKTDAGNCRVLYIQLNDGISPASANFQFKK